MDEEDKSGPVFDRATGMWDFRATSIPDLRERLKKLAQDWKEIPQIVRELCTFASWAVLKNKVLIWTGEARALITVNDSAVQIETFPDFVHRDSFYYYVAYPTVGDLKPLRKALLERMVDQEEYTDLYYGNYVDFLLDGLTPYRYPHPYTGVVIEPE